jgi:hypothetical protein
MVTVWFVSVLKKLASPTDISFFKSFSGVKLRMWEASEPEEEHGGGRDVNASARPQGVILWSGYQSRLSHLNGIEKARGFARLVGRRGSRG